jgi:hypothetical protein
MNLTNLPDLDINEVYVYKDKKSNNDLNEKEFILRGGEKAKGLWICSKNYIEYMGEDLITYLGIGSPVDSSDKELLNSIKNDKLETFLLLYSVKKSIEYYSNTKNSNIKPDFIN